MGWDGRQITEAENGKASGLQGNYKKRTGVN